MAGDEDGVQGLSARMDTARRRGNTIKELSLSINHQNLADGMY